MGCLGEQRLAPWLHKAVWLPTNTSRRPAWLLPGRYGWHFPEMSKIVTDNIQYGKAVKLMGMRDLAAGTDFSGGRSSAPGHCLRCWPLERASS